MNWQYEQEDSEWPFYALMWFMVKSDAGQNYIVPFQKVSILWGQKTENRLFYWARKGKQCALQAKHVVHHLQNT